MNDRDDRADDLAAASGGGAEEPQNDPAGQSEDSAEEPFQSVEGDPAAEEAAWQDIVEHFGDRALLEDDPSPSSRLFEQKIDVVEEPVATVFDDDEERFVPPTVPPLPRPTPARFLAWAGVLGAPVIVLVLITITKITGYPFPGWAIGILVAAFLGGFAYLLFTMPQEPRDPWDDGARV